MKILHINSFFNARSGGQPAAVDGLATAQAVAGHEVTIFTTNADHPSGRLDVPTDRPIKTGNRTVWYHRISYFSVLYFSSSFARRLHSEIKRFDIVHIHGLYRFPVTYAAWYARKKGVPYIVSPHGSLDPYLYRQSGFGRWALPLKRIYEYYFDMPNLRQASAIHFIGEKEKEKTEYLKLGSKSIIVPIGIDWSEYQNLPARGGFRRRLKLDDKASLVLFLGRINFKKGLDLLIPAFSRVVEKVPNARLAIVGPDNEGYAVQVKKWCHQTEIVSKVFFVEHLSAPDVRCAYVDADVFVLSSYSENFGITVAEAMACECPVVISDQVDIWEVVKETQSGIVTQLDVGEISDALFSVLDNKDRARKMGENGRALIKNRFSWTIVAQQMIHEYKKILAQE